MACVDLQLIDGDECIGASLPKINGNFAALSSAVCDLSANSPFNVFDSPTIDLDWNASTRTLSADVKDASVTNAKIAFDGGAFAFRNKIINGDMKISQRGATFTSTTGGGGGLYTLDRFKVSNTTEGTVVISQDANVPTTTKEFGYSLKCQVTTADTSLASDDYFTIWQNIEGFNVRDLIGNTFTLSFWVRSSKTGIHSVAFRNGEASPNLDASYVVQYVINTSNTWEYKTITVNGGINSSIGNYWNFTNGGGLSVMFTIAGGTLYSTSVLNSWQNQNFIASSNIVNILDTVGNTFYITGVQLEKGPTATPFEHRPIGTELALCQRYYQSYSGNITNAGYTTNGTAQVYTMFLPVPMRVSPVINFTPANVATATLAYFDDGGSNDRVFFGVFSTSNPGVFQYTAQNATFNAEL